MKVLLVDDHTIFRQGLRALLQSDPAIQVVGEAENGLDAVQLVDKLSPDVVVMDIAMPDLGGMEATTQIRQKKHNVQVVILSRYSDSAHVNQALKSGALGYVLKEAAFDELKLALDAVIKGQPYLSPSVLQPVVSDYLKTLPENEAISIFYRLSNREREVFHLLASGRGRQEISETLNISPKTADRHKASVMKKLSLACKEDIYQFAKQIGLEKS